MNFKRLICLASLLLVVTATTTFQSKTCEAQQIVWNAYHKAGNDAHAAKDTKLALQLHARALEEARREDSRVLLAESAARLGEIQYESGHYPESEEAFLVSLGAFESQHAENPDKIVTRLGHVDVVRVLQGMAGALQKQNKHADAERYLRDALRIAERRPKPDTHQMLQLVNGLAHCLYSQGDSLAAHALVKQGVALAKTKRGGDSLATAETGLLHAALLSESGDHEAAATVATESLAKVEKALGADHPRAARARLFVGRMHHLRGATEDARKAVIHARESLKAHHGDDHPIIDAADELHKIVHESPVETTAKPTIPAVKADDAASSRRTSKP